MLLIIKTVIFLFIILVSSVSFADMIIGGETIYHVTKGDTLELIGAKVGVNWRIIVKENRIDIKKHLKIGQEIKVNKRKIVPKTTESGIIINIPDRMLYFFKEGRLVSAFPVGLGKATWQTPIGIFRITGKVKNPTWYVPESIQQEMSMKGDPVKDIVPPGPENPLGKYALKTTIPSVLIHETIWPTSVYQFRSHGCIRVIPQDMEKFFGEVDINTPGEIIYNTVKVAISENERVFLEVHRDIYGRVNDLRDRVISEIERKGVAEKVDWKKVDRMIIEMSGIAEDITL